MEDFHTPPSPKKRCPSRGLQSTPLGNDVGSAPLPSSSLVSGVHSLASISEELGAKDNLTSLPPDALPLRVTRRTSPIADLPTSQRCVMCDAWMAPANDHPACLRCISCTSVSGCRICASWSPVLWRSVRRLELASTLPAPSVREPLPCSSRLVTPSLATPPDLPRPRPAQDRSRSYPSPTNQSGPCSPGASQVLSHVGGGIVSPSPGINRGWSGRGRSDVLGSTVRRTTRGDASGSGNVGPVAGGQQADPHSQVPQEPMGEYEYEWQDAGDSSFLSSDPFADALSVSQNELTLARSAVDAAWEVIQATLNPERFDTSVAPEEDLRVLSYFFEESGSVQEPTISQSSGKIPQFRRSFNKTLAGPRFSNAGLPAVRALLPSSIPLLRNVPLSVMSERPLLPPRAVPFLGKPRESKVPLKHHVLLSADWDSQVSAASFLELAAGAHLRILKSGTLDQKAIQDLFYLSEALSVVSSATLMSALRGSSRATMLTRDAVLEHSRLPQDVQASLRQAPLVGTSLFGESLLPVLDKLRDRPPQPRRQRPFRPSGASAGAPRAGPSGQPPSTQATIHFRPRPSALRSRPSIRGRGRGRGRRQ